MKTSDPQNQSAPISDGYPQNQPEKNIQENFTRCFDPEVDWDLNYLETTCFSEDSVGRKIPIDVQYPTFTVTHSAMEGSFEKSKIQRIRNTNNRRCKIRKPSLTLANSKKFIFLLKSVALLLILGGLVIFWVSRHTPQNYSGEYKELMSSEIGDWSEISERPSTKALYSHNRHEKPNDNGHRQSSQPDTPALSANTRDNGIRAMERVAGLPTVKGATPEENRSGSNQKGGIPQGDLESSGPFPGINSIPELIPQNDFSDLLSPGVDEQQDRMSPLDENGRQPEIPNAPSSENSPPSLPEMKSTVANNLLADSGKADSGVNNRATNNISPNNESNGTSRAEMNPSPVITSLFQALTPDIDTGIVDEAQFAGSNPEINTPAVSDSGAENNTVTEDDSNTTPASSAPAPILVANVLTPKINQDQSSVETVPVPGTPVASHYNVLLPAVGTNDIPESVKNGQAPSSVPEQSPVAELTGTPEIPENRDTPLSGSIQNNPNVPADSPAVAPAIQTTATETEELEPITDMPLSSLQHPAEQEPAANELVPNQFPTAQISHPKLQDSPSDQFRQNEENQPSESLLTNHPVTFNAPLANPENDLSIKPLEEIQQMAEHGNAEAQNEYGNRCFHGQGMEADQVLAVQWYQKAADQGNPSARNNLASCYLNGYGVNPDLEQAIQLYRQAAMQGHPAAQTNYAYAFYYGQGMPQDLSEAVAWFTKAAEQNYPDAQLELANCYKEGIGVDKDSQQAFQLYQLAAQQGNAIAQFELAECYAHGEGIGQNKPESMRWYLRAAGQGNTDALDILRQMRKNDVPMEATVETPIKRY